MAASVILPTHNPHPGRLGRAIAGLRHQDPRAAQWDLIIVDNASAQPVAAPAGLPNARVVVESNVGLSSARRKGFTVTAAEFLVLVDDDNVLAPDYLAQVVRLFREHPRIGVLGGRSVPEFETPPPAWVRDFDGLLACRDLGPAPLVSRGLRPVGATRNHYPSYAPIGAGMALRREAAEAWLNQADGGIPDRQGRALSSGGDNDIVLSAMRAGWEVGYFPELQLTHLIPISRTTPEYLGRLNEDIARSWIQVLRRHAACPWPPIPPWTAPLRTIKAWFAHRAWRSPAHHIRWRGARGHFGGLAAPFPPRSGA